jgi:hypothetical protein
MVNRSKTKGTAAETAIVRYLQAAGAVHAERRALTGAHDRGDIAGIVGVVIESKSCARDQLPAWVDEAELEGLNDGAEIAFVWHKRRGTTDPGRWFVTMTGRQIVEMLRMTGHLPPTAEGAA